MIVPILLLLVLDPVQPLAERIRETAMKLVFALVFLAPDSSQRLNSESETLAERIRAVERIERLGADGKPDVTLLPGLVAHLGARDERLRGLAALAISRHVVAVGEKPPEGLVNALVSKLGDANPHLSGLCARSLAILGPKALPDIAEWLRPEMGPARSVVKRRLALEACRVLGRVKSAQTGAERLFWLALRDEEPELAERARRLLLSLRNQTKPPPFGDTRLLVAALGSPSESIRDLAWQGLLALKERGYAGAIQLMEQDTAERYSVGVRLAELLYQAGHEPLPHDLVHLLKHSLTPTSPEERSLRRWLVPLAQMQMEPEPERVKAIDARLATLAGEGGVWQEARQEWREHPEESAWVLMARMNSAAPEIQTEAAAGLRELIVSLPVTRGLLDTLALGVYSPAPRVADLSVQMLEIVLIRRSPRGVPPSVRDALMAGLLDLDLHERRRCLTALASLGASIETRVGRMLRDRNPQVRRDGLDILIPMMQQHGHVPDALRPLVSNCLYDKEPDIVTRARTANTLFTTTPRRRP